MSTTELRVYQPNRLARRKIAGQSCSYCHLYLHFRDILAAELDGSTFYLHSRCMQMLVKPTEPDTERETDSVSESPNKENDNT